MVKKGNLGRRTLKVLKEERQGRNLSTKKGMNNEITREEAGTSTIDGRF